MPHLVLEYSANLLEKDVFTEVFAKLHRLLSEKLPTQLASCKSRAYEVTDYYLADGNPANAFIALHVRIMPGRSTELLNEIAAEIFAILQNAFKASLVALDLQISVEISDLGRVYVK